MNFEQLNSRASEIMKQAVNNGEAAGAGLLVLKDGKEIISHQEGFADISAGITMSRDTIVRLYSMSKPVTGAAVMLLMERGLIDLNDPVSAYIPEYSEQYVIRDEKKVRTERPMRIHDLLFMTSGLSYGSDSAAGKAASALITELEERLKGSNPMTTLEFARRAGQNPLEFIPGERFMYGTSADILGAVVEIVTGKSFGTFLKEELFEPLEMKDTGFYVPAEKQSRLAKVYQKSGSGLELYTDNHLGISNTMKMPPAFESGGAGLVSTLDDYSHFAAMLLNHGSYNGRQIMQPGTVKYFTTGSLQPWQQYCLASNWCGLEGYSYGNLLRVMKDPSLAIMQTTIGEYGWDGWLGPYFSNHPDINVTFLASVQLKDAGTTPLVRKLRNIILPSLSQL